MCKISLPYSVKKCLTFTLLDQVAVSIVLISRFVTGGINLFGDQTALIIFIQRDLVPVYVVAGIDPVHSGLQLKPRGRLY
jgi:TRAP-type C4-dicarboxylate transport system permease large subunit